MSQQNWDAAEYKRHASFVPLFANEVMELLNPEAGEEILDLGCGDGELTLEIKQKGCSVIGIDSSPSMVESTRIQGIEAYVLDGHNISYINKFDAVFSNAALHWLTQPEKVIKGVYSSLKTNGRFVAEFGGNGNVTTLIQAMREVFEENEDFGYFVLPWFFPTVKEYTCLLEKEGFEVENITLTQRPTLLKSGVEKWIEIFAEGITGHLSNKQKNKFLALVNDKLIPTLYTENNEWIADYVRLRFKAIKT